MANSNPVRVAIIGCGLIGTQWDADLPSQAFSLTHAAGFSKNAFCDLIAVCDKDLIKAQQAAYRWGAQHAYSDPRELFVANQIDLVVIATSSAVRWEIIESAVAARVKVLVIEKPLATTLDESKKIINAIDSAGIKTVVNFSRHWDPSMRLLRSKIAHKQLGAVQRMVGLYGKGITNNGSHMIDLAAFLCDATPLRARSLGSPLDAVESTWSAAGERALDAQVELIQTDGNIIQLTMLGTDQSVFTCFELRVIGTLGTCEITLGGRKITQTPTQPDPHYPAYTVLADPISQTAKAMESMNLMVEEAIQLAQNKIERSSCDAHAALQTALAVEAIKLSQQEQQRWVDIATLPCE